VARATASAPGATEPSGPRGPSTAKAASAPASRMRRTMARTPAAPPREVEPRTMSIPRRGSAQACSAPSRDKLTMASVRRRRAQRSSASCWPCQKA
jgi:hypothetical protein